MVIPVKVGQRETPHERNPSYYNGRGQRVSRRSSDDVWPLRRANGKTWSEEK